MVILVPTINDDARDFETLFRLWAQVNHDELDVTFDFSTCQFLRQNAVAFLGGLTRLIQHRRGVVRFAWQTMRSPVRANLNQNGFHAALSGEGGPWSGNSIPFREDRVQSPDNIVDYLKNNWLGHGWVSVSAALRNAIVGVLWEIYANAFEHAASPIGLFSCGQHFPRQKELNLTVLDFGIGIPSAVRSFFGRHDLMPDQTMKWAFQAGTTTRPGTGRGLGLDMLKQFVRLNQGVLEVFSHSGHARIDSSGENYLSRQVFYEGTLVNVGLRCDEKYYCLTSELSDAPLF